MSSQYGREGERNLHARGEHVLPARNPRLSRPDPLLGAFEPQLLLLPAQLRVAAEGVSDLLHRMERQTQRAEHAQRCRAPWPKRSKRRAQLWF